MVKDGILFGGLDMVGLQESILANPASRTLLSIGRRRINKWIIFNSIDTVGGVLLGWNDDLFECLEPFGGIYVVSGVFKCRKVDFVFCFSTVYAPVNREEKAVLVEVDFFLTIPSSALDSLW